MAETIKLRGRGLFSGNKVLTALLAIIFVVMLVFGLLSPLSADDYTYCFSFATGERISSVSMIIESMVAHRSCQNGRVISHGIVQLLLMLPKPIFDVLNALNVTLMFYFIYRYIKEADSAGGKQVSQLKYPLMIFCAAALLWCFTPTWGWAYLWLTGSVNYSWAVTIFLIHLFPYYMFYLGKERRLGIPARIFLLINAFTVGAYNEGVSCAAIFLSFLLMAAVLIRDKRHSWQLIFSFVLACLGFLFLSGSSAEQGRMGLDWYTIWHSILEVTDMYSGDLLPLFILYGAELAVCLYLRTDPKTLILSLLVFSAGVVSSAVFIFAIYVPGRAFCCFCVYTVLASALLFSELWNRGYRVPAAAVSGVLAAMFAIQFVIGAVDIVWLWSNVRHRMETIAEAQAQGVTELELTHYENATFYTACAGEVSDDPTSWLNEPFAKYYGFDKVWTTGE